MASATPFFRKPPTAPYAALQPLAAALSSNPPDYAVQLNGTGKQNKPSTIITTILCCLAFTSTLLGYILAAKSLPFPLPAWAQYLDFLNLIHTISSNHLLTLLTNSQQAFSDQANFTCLAVQASLYEALMEVLPSLDPKAADVSPRAKPICFICNFSYQDWGAMLHGSAAEVQGKQDEFSTPCISIFIISFSIIRNVISRIRV